jgi:hypothetical protein
MTAKERERVLRGFSPAASQTYLEKKPSLSLLCKPKIMPLKSPNLLLLERMQADANTRQIAVPNVFGESH